MPRNRQAGLDPVYPVHGAAGPCRIVETLGHHGSTADTALGAVSVDPALRERLVQNPLPHRLRQTTQSQTSRLTASCGGQHPHDQPRYGEVQGLFPVVWPVAHRAAGVRGRSYFETGRHCAMCRPSEGSSTANRQTRGDLRHARRCARAPGNSSKSARCYGWKTAECPTSSARGGVSNSIPVGAWSRESVCRGVEGVPCRRSVGCGRSPS